MSSEQLKQQLHYYIDKADDRILQAMFVMLQNYVEEEDAIIGYTVEGKPLTKKEMQEALESSVNEAKKGYGHSSDDIRKSKKNW